MQADLDKITVHTIFAHKMTVDEMTVDEMTVYETNGEKMPKTK
jgi:hypothetical protein